MTSRVSQLVISKTLSVSPARKLRSVPGFPHISLREMYHARPALHTVFSTTQLEPSKTQCDSCHYGLEMQLNCIIHSIAIYYKYKGLCT